MNFEELQGYYLRIVCGYSVVGEIDNYVIVHDPRPQDQILGKKYYDQTLLKLMSQGTLTEDQSMLLLKEKGLWNNEQDTSIKELEDNLSKLNKSLQGLDFKSTEKRVTLQYIEKTKSKMKELLSVKNSLLVNSVEYLARYELYKYYVYLLTYDTDGKRLWQNWEDFKNAPNHFVNKLVNEAYANNKIDEVVIRRLARGEPWRSAWLAAVKTGDLFGRPTTEMTDYQRALVTWSIIYDNAYENPDCPSTEVVENDILFNIWLEKQADKRNKEAVNIDTFISNEKIRGAGEIFIMADSHEDAEKVYKLNNPLALSSVKQREKKLVKEGMVKETDMPDVKKRFQMELNNMFAAHRKQE